MTALPIVIDCDPGVDDALALLLAMAEAPRLDIAAITTVAGNVGAVATERNARRLRDLAGRPDIPVFGGCRRPLLKPFEDAAHVHGESGMDGSGLPPPEGHAAATHAVTALLDLVAARRGALTLCALGPLTNVATAIVQRPDIMATVRQIVLMGGAAGAGNVTPHAEFNFYCDPHAARIVFESGIPIVMHGLDVTHRARVDAAWLDGVAAGDTAVTRAVAGMMGHYGGGVAGNPQGRPVHDALVIAYLTHPEWFTGETCQVVIETADTPEIGRSQVIRGARPDAANAKVMFEIDAAAFRAYLADRLRAL